MKLRPTHSLTGVKSRDASASKKCSLQWARSTLQWFSYSLLAHFSFSVIKITHPAFLRICVPSFPVTVWPEIFHQQLWFLYLSFKRDLHLWIDPTKGHESRLPLGPWFQTLEEDYELCFEQSCNFEYYLLQILDLAPGEVYIALNEVGSSGDLPRCTPAHCAQA